MEWYIVDNTRKDLTNANDEGRIKQSKALTEGALFVDLIVWMTGWKEYRSQSDISVF